LRDLLDKGHTGREIRWLLMSAQYRQPLNFTIDGLQTARTVLRRIDDFNGRLREAATDSDEGAETAAALIQTAESAFRAGLEDDLNIALATAAFFDFMRDVNKELDAGAFGGDAANAVLDFCRRLDQVFGVFYVDAQSGEVPAEILARVDEREAARATRDFAAADAIRDELAAAGWIIEDSPKGARVKPVR